MYFIIGLGNQGEEYAKTRHNVGFLAIEYIARKMDSNNWKHIKKLYADITQCKINSNDVTLIKPDTFMNLSGKSVNAVFSWHPCKIENIIVIHDDIDIPFGQYKIQKNRGSAGHNGVKSIIDAVRSKNFTRVRIGIHPTNITDKISAMKVVLKRFNKKELAQLESIFEKITIDIKKYIT